MTLGPMYILQRHLDPLDKNILELPSSTFPAAPNSPMHLCTFGPKVGPELHAVGLTPPNIGTIYSMIGAPGIGSAFQIRPRAQKPHDLVVES